MGNFEKLVVLTVLFLAAIILGVTLHEDGSVGPEEPLGKVSSPKETVADSGSGAKSAPKTNNSRGALSSMVKNQDAKQATQKPAAKAHVETHKPRPKAKAKPAGAAKSLFKTTAGLTKPEFGDDYMIYTWRSGDTIAAVAGRYYGDRKLRYLIRNNNEDAAYRPGDAINLPLRDTAAEAGLRPVFKPAPAHVAPKKAPVVTRTVQSYTVQDGDSLWSIAKNAYGKGTKWEQIFKANRDQLDDSADLRPGMVLRIP